MWGIGPLISTQLCSFGLKYRDTRCVTRSERDLRVCEPKESRPRRTRACVPGLRDRRVGVCVFVPGSDWSMLVQGGGNVSVGCSSMHA